MRTKLHSFLHLSRLVLLLGLQVAFGPQLSTCFAQGTAFSYQGRLSDNGSPAAGVFDFRFRLASDAEGNNFVGSPVVTNSMAVADGLINVSLDFGSVFSGSDFWLQVEVRTNNATGYTVLAPLQPVTAVPYALYAMTPAGPKGDTGATGPQGPKGDTGAQGPAGASLFSLSGTNVFYVDGFVGIGTNNPATALSVKGTVSANNFTGDGADLTGLNPSNLGSGTAGINISGNASTANNFSGSLTGDVTGTQGATVVSTVGGQSAANVASGAGAANNATSANTASTIVKRDGSGNFTAGAVTAASFSGNGANLTSLNAGNFSSGTVPDGRLAANVARTTQVWLLGGNSGTTPGAQFIGTADNQPLEFRVNGQRGLRIEPNTNAAPNVIGGAPFNYVSNGVVGATIAGGGATNYSGIKHTNSVTGDFGTVGGGAANTSGYGGTVSGGSGNTASGTFATISGGFNNTATNTDATVSGGAANTASENITTVGGGADNTASGVAATVGGGLFNSASGNYATGGGGQNNTASGVSATVPGGTLNTASGDYSFAAGHHAQALNKGSFVWADDSSSANLSSTADNQFLIRAAGGVGIGTTSPQAALHVKRVNAQLRLEDPNFSKYWNIYTEALGTAGASGNLLFLSSSGNYVYFDTGGVVHDASDRRLKRDITPMGTVLDRVLQLRPVSYRFRSQPEDAPLTLGLIAQEVEPLFPEVVGERAAMKSLAYSELIPVTIGAIQELNQKLEAGNQESDVRIRKLQAENAKLKRSVDELKSMVNALAQRLDGGER